MGAEIGTSPNPSSVKALDVQDTNPRCILPANVISMYNLIEKFDLPVPKPLIHNSMAAFNDNFHIRMCGGFRDWSLTALPFPASTAYLHLGMPFLVSFVERIKEIWHFPGMKRTYLQVAAEEIAEKVGKSMDNGIGLMATLALSWKFCKTTSSKSPTLASFYVPFPDFPSEHYEKCVRDFVTAIAIAKLCAPKDKEKHDSYLVETSNNFVRRVLEKESSVRNDLDSLLQHSREHFYRSTFPLFAQDWTVGSWKKSNLVSELLHGLRKYVLAHPLAAINKKWTPRLSITGTERAMGLPTSIAVHILEYAASELFPFQCLPRELLRGLVYMKPFLRFAGRSSDKDCVFWCLTLLYADQELKLTKEGIDSQLLRWLVQKQTKDDAYILANMDLPCKPFASAKAKIRCILALREEIKFCREKAVAEITEVREKEKELAKEKEEAGKKRKEEEEKKKAAKAEAMEAAKKEKAAKAEAKEVAKKEKALKAAAREGAKKERAAKKAEKQGKKAEKDTKEPAKEPANAPAKEAVKKKRESKERGEGGPGQSVETDKKRQRLQCRRSTGLSGKDSS